MHLGWLLRHADEIRGEPARVYALAANAPDGSHVFRAFARLRDAKPPPAEAKCVLERVDKPEDADPCLAAVERAHGRAGNKNIQHDFNMNVFAQF